MSIKPETVENAKIPFHHRPDLEDATDDAWQEAMGELQPQGIIFETGFFTELLQVKAHGFNRGMKRGATKLVPNN